MERFKKIRDAAIAFFFPDESDAWLTLLRVGVGLVVLCYAGSLAKHWSFLLGTSESALVTRDFSEALLALQSRFVPRIGWLVDAGNTIGLGEPSVLGLTWLCLFCSALAVTLGIFTRFVAVVCWFIHLCVAKSSDFVSYGVDSFITVGLFYLMLSPLPDRFSLDRMLRNPRPANPIALGFFHRVLQLHLCLIYFFSGLTKCLGAGWWNGENLWRALTRPPFDVISAAVLVRFKLFFPVTGIGICLLETMYPIFIWRARTRFLWLSAILLMHVAIGLMMGMYLFAMIMIILNLAAFGPDILPIVRKVRATAVVRVASAAN
jgi:hypothetical protein